MTVLNTADWLLSCSTPSSATSMNNPGTVHVCVTGFITVVFALSILNLLLNYISPASQNPFHYERNMEILP